MRRPLLLLLLMLPLAGCPAFYVQEGAIVRPATTLDEPTSLPAPDVDAALATHWQREAQLGLGGSGTATLLDPGLVAAQVAHQAADESLSPAAAQSLLDERWTDLFGQGRDRFAIDLAWRFDTQFYATHDVLDPDTWSFALETSSGQRLAPLEVTPLAADTVPREHFWTGTVQLSFPWHDADGNRVLGGATKWIRLVLTRSTGSGRFEWRFRGPYG
ncbi:MAG TPA: hypothetical protein V6D47_07720 [Oscillatoriaceae cyanobacterium]